MAGGLTCSTVDGDTLDVDTEFGEARVRLIVIDTPETKEPGTPVECGGEQATAELEGYVGKPT